MRIVTAYGRLLDALEILRDAQTCDLFHTGTTQRQHLSRIADLIDQLRAARIERPDDQIDGDTVRAILLLYNAACRARFFAGCESNVSDFVEASRDAQAAASALYHSGGSESWSRFPPS